MAPTNDQAIYWTHFAHEEWDLCMAMTATGVCFTSAQNEPVDDLFAWAAKRSQGPLVQDDDRLGPYARQLIDYFLGKRKNFTLPFDLMGTPFQLAVWKALMEIPYGTTRSYSDIAARIQKPTAVRAVGGAIGANPALVLVPCHRVIGKDGSLTGFREGLDMKSKLLQLEGIGTLQD